MANPVLSLSAVLLLACIGATADAKEESNVETEQLHGFLDKLYRSVKEASETEKQRHEQRQEWCAERLQFLQAEGKRAEGIMENLRGAIRQLKSHKEDKMMLIQMTGVEALNVNSSAVDGQSRALQISTKARLGELQERLKLRGGSSSATHRFAAAMRESCEGAQQRSEFQLKALAQQADSLSSAMEAISAAQALHGIDESTLQAAAAEAQEQVHNFAPLGQVSFLQTRQTKAGGMPDLLSFFRKSLDSNGGRDDEDDLDGLSLPFHSRPGQHRGVELPAMPEAERPKVLDLLAKVQTDGTQLRSKKEAWCNEERDREQKAMQTAQVSVMMFSADAMAHARVKAQLEDELDHVKTGTTEFTVAAHRVLEEAANETKALDGMGRDTSIAAKVLQKAVQSLSGLREQWWGHSASNPVDAATKSLSDVQQSFEKQAASCAGFRKQVAESAKAVAGRARDAMSAFDVEGHKLQLNQDFYAKRQRRSESSQRLYESQVQSSQSYLKRLQESCDKKNLQQQSREKQAQMKALRDAEMVFAGQRIKAPVVQGLRGSSSKNLSPMEKAALEMGVTLY